ncbi:ABC transporter permease [Sporolactobacillus vineae]|uniref:ABC transporter permease n=1 Tax=Sporolactobacillus vineae TaxID=444463 RepID=UPI0002894B69|nr:ABC transporter permease [Sporolactobacillus vineae]
MREIAAVFLSTVRMNFRDRRSLIFMILFPIVLTLILGTALSSVSGSSDTAEKLDSRAALINQDHGAMAGRMEKFFRSPEIRKIVHTKTYRSLSTAKADLKKQKLDAIIVINKGFTQAVENGSSKKLDFITSGDMESSLIKNITQSYLQRINAYRAAAAFAPQPAAPLLADHALSINGKIPRSSDYYAVTMLIMIILYASAYGLNVVREMNLSPIGYRIRSLPVRQINYLIGKTLGQLATVFLQIIVLVTFFKFIYHANFGSNLPFIFLVCFLLGFIIILLSIALALLFSYKMADTILDLAIPVATFLAGGYVKLSILDTNPIAVALNSWLPNAVAQNLVFQNIYGGTGQTAAGGVLKLTLIALAILLLTIAALRRNNHADLSK